MPSLSKDANESNELSPRTTSYEFLGPPGALFVTLVAPFTTYALYFSCTEAAGGCPPPLSTLLDRCTFAVSDLRWWKSLWDTQAAIYYLAFYAYLIATWFILPGNWLEGVPLRTGERNKYKINALSTLLLTLSLVSSPTALPASHFCMKNGSASSLRLCHRPLRKHCIVTFHPLRKGSYLLWEETFIYDFFIGRELNPSIGSYDIKSFNELRPGLILWARIDISMLCAQAARRGGFDKVTDSMWLVVFFHLPYVVDALYNEPAIFTTIDIISDGLGFMLTFDLLTWVPFVYSLQARHLVFNQVELGWLASAAILTVNFAGYYIFRASNGEKNDFRNGRNPKSTLSISGLPV